MSDHVYLTGYQIKECIPDDKAVYVSRYDYDELKAELDKTKEALRLTGEGRPSEWAYTQLLNDFKAEKLKRKKLSDEYKESVAYMQGVIAKDRAMLLKLCNRVQDYASSGLIENFVYDEGMSSKKGCLSDIVDEAMVEK